MSDGATVCPLCYTGYKRIEMELKDMPTLKETDKFPLTSVPKNFKEKRKYWACTGCAYRVEEK